jgi:hypothetical protein
MQWVRFSNLAVGSLPTAVLLIVLTVFLITLKKKSMAAWMLIGYFSVLSIMLLAYVIRYSVVSTFGFSTGQAANLIVFGIVSYLLFAYLFQKNYHPKESIILAALFSAGALYAYISNFVRYPVLEKVYDFQAQYFTYVFGARISIVTGLGYFWIIVIFFRKTAAASPYEGPCSARLESPSVLIRMAGRFCIFFVKILRPRGREARSYRSLALLTVGMFGISFFYMLMSIGAISRQTYGIIFNAVGLLTTFSIFLVYTNNTFEPSSFRWKLIGLSLAPVMLVLGIVSSILLSYVDSSFDRMRRVESMTIRSMVLAKQTRGLPLYVAYIASRPSRKSAHGGPYELQLSRIEGLRAEDFTESDRMQYTIPLNGEGELERRYRYFDPFDVRTFYVHYDLVLGRDLYEVGYRYIWYRGEIHRSAIKLFYVILGAALIVLVLFPLFFYRSLFKIDLRIF